LEMLRTAQYRRPRELRHQGRYGSGIRTSPNPPCAAARPHILGERDEALDGDVAERLRCSTRTVCELAFSAALGRVGVLRPLGTHRGRPDVPAGARPGEAVEHRHVHGSTVELPGRKTALAWRTVHMTSRGVDSVARVPRSIATRRVFHVEGRPISWVYFWREVWRPALETAELDYRAPYNLRHTFAYWSLRAGVPIATVAREMGHESTEHTFRVYGGWCLEVGADAAAMREAWAASRPTTWTAVEE
jgi:hypothetical protein